jgi:hypothetical protein
MPCQLEHVVINTYVKSEFMWLTPNFDAAKNINSAQIVQCCISVMSARPTAAVGTALITNIRQRNFFGLSLELEVRAQCSSMLLA